MTNLELIEAHQEGTKFCSLSNHMKKVSPTYDEIIAKGRDIVPDILKYLRDNEETAGMSIMLLLWDILKISPYEPKQIGDTDMAAYDVASAQEAWIQWGIKEKLI